MIDSVGVQESIGGHTANAYVRRQPDQSFPVARRDGAAPLHLGDCRRLNVEGPRDGRVASQLIYKGADIHHVE